MRLENFKPHMTGRSVLVTNLPSQGVAKDDLYNLFCGYGKIISIDFPMSKRSRFSSIAYISFTSSMHSLSACMELNDVDVFGDGYPLNLCQGVFIH